MATVSIIIPTLNEEKYLPATLERLMQLIPLPHEIIVVDGSSQDRTREVAQHYSVVLRTVAIARRSTQMNQGANIAEGDFLCFLHADTLVPTDLVTRVQHTLADKQVVLGGFISLMKGNRTRRLTTSLNFIKTYLAPLLYRPDRFLFRHLRLLFGDQVMFCRRTDFLRCGGFNRKLPIMEEADLCLKMNRLGKIKQVSHTVVSSDRRLHHWGPWKAHFVWFSICALWALRVSPNWLKKFYTEIR
ncbi:TIGR04283 family arsenosugar biosynthesis glycosyltransferase [Tunicatimonas pelagia]|uniref:TIGR04283 family arsenosugar biosynthesis glycosyltransferase n=1 Tax=Tunicatimonas pelagia TaxID=931531 RepID=UPI00266572E8|nr:TIGR04283 family arsenosugar biosynthesis glycosyltransferase [Tunicatimonas pelagia]WKN42042.1 TIGR04283 family arsenosugar biosynthesis glycosyltransferase [Tunicatimonas pelagia]